jgi:hypothetical protein
VFRILREEKLGNKRPHLGVASINGAYAMQGMLRSSSAPKLGLAGEGIPTLPNAKIGSLWFAPLILLGVLT